MTATKQAAEGTTPPGQPEKPLAGLLGILVRKGNGALLGFLLFSATAAVFFPSLHNDFVAWDDNRTFYENSHIQGLDGPRLRWMFTDVAYSMRYKPLSWLAYALIYKTQGMNAFGFHLAALVLHCLNTVLCFVTLRMLLAAGFGPAPNGRLNDVISLSAALGALLWAVNPLRVEPVARATDLTYDQSLFLTLISLCCYLRAVTEEPGRTRKSWYAGSVAAFGLAMLSYPFVFGFAGVLVVLDFYPLRRYGTPPHLWRDGAARRILLEKLPFFAFASLIGLTFVGRLHPEGIFAARPTNQHLDPFGVVMQAMYVWAYYLWKPWVPFHLSPIYGTLVNFDPWTWKFVASAITIVVLAAFLVWKRRVWPLGLALLVCHLVLLLPALGLTEHPHFANDRYGHVTGILWSVLIASGIVKYCRQPGRILTAATGVIALSVVLGLLSREQLRVWRDTPTLFRHMIAELGDDPLQEYMYVCLGAWYEHQQDHEEAARQYRVATRLIPQDPEAHENLGVVLFNEGKLEASAQELEEALRLDPNRASAHGSMGATLLLLGRGNEAADQFQEAARLAPKDPRPHEMLGILLSKLGRLDESARELREAVRLEPDDWEANEHLGVLLCDQGRTAEAIQSFQRALATRPDSAESHNGLGAALLQENRLDEAMAQFQAALDLKPDYAEAHNGAGVALFKLGRVDEAITHFQAALKIRPDYADARSSLAFALAQKNKDKNSR